MMLDTNKTAALCLIATLASSVVGCAADEEESASGEQAVSDDSSIIGGTVTSDYAAVGALTRYGQSFCTGTVVAPRLVVTAAHCLADLRGSNIRFALGTRASAPEASIPVAGYAAHPAYNAARITNDIGVVVLAQDAPVTPVTINSSMTASWVGHPLEFVGFGATNGRTGAGTGTKRAVTIPVSQVGAAQFSYADPSRNTCFGDSGGPAFTRSKEGALILVGVTSYGDPSCTRYGVDTRVDVYRSFIASALQK